MAEHCSLPDGLATIMRGRVGAFRRSEAFTVGCTEAQVRARLDSGAWRLLRGGVYAEHETLKRAARDPELLHLLRAEALALAADDIVLSHGTAARFLHLACLRTQNELVHATRAPRPGQSPWVDTSVDVHRAALPPDHIVRIGDVALTTPARTVADIARMPFSFRAGVVVGDSALASGQSSRQEISAVVATMTRWPGVKQARAVAGCIDARAQSPLESIAHATWSWYGLPRPELQVWAFDSGGFVGIVDGVMGTPPVVYETDGLTKYRELAEADTLEREKLRQERLEAAGLVVRRFGWDQLWREPEGCIYRMRSGLAEAARRARPRVRLYVGDPDTPALAPESFGRIVCEPTSMGLRLTYDGLQIAA